MDEGEGSEVVVYLCGLLKEPKAIRRLSDIAGKQVSAKRAAQSALSQIGGQEAADVLEQLLETQELTRNLLRALEACGTEKNAKNLEEKASKETDEERAKIFKDTADLIRKRIEKESKSQE